MLERLEPLILRKLSETGEKKDDCTMESNGAFKATGNNLFKGPSSWSERTKSNRNRYRWDFNGRSGFEAEKRLSHEKTRRKIRFITVRWIKRPLIGEKRRSERNRRSNFCNNLNSNFWKWLHLMSFSFSFFFEFSVEESMQQTFRKFFELQLSSGVFFRRYPKISSSCGTNNFGFLGWCSPRRFSWSTH